jgi:hypothetical protein
VDDLPGLTERQLGVLGALEERSPKLAGMYHTALDSLDSQVQENAEPARVAVICHCMRELMNGLPSVLAADSEPRPNPSSSSITSKLPGLLAKHPEVDLGVEQDIIPVPRAVAQVFNELIGTVVREEGRNLRNAAALITKGSDTKHPAIKQWRDTYNFFLNWAHLDRNHERERDLPGQGILLASIKVVEDVIEVCTAAFFENVHAVADLLAEINEQSEEQP